MRPNKSFNIIIIIFSISVLISWMFFLKEYTQADTVSIHEFPKQIGAWTSEEILISDREYDVLETRNAFTRKYSTPDGKEVILFIVYSQNNRKVSHPPELCYTGGGATFVNNVHRDIKLETPPYRIDSNKILVDFKDFEQILYYWFKVGDTFTPNYWKQQALIAAKSLLGQPASSALIRLSSDVKNNDPEKAAATIEEFVHLITPEIFKYLP